MSRGPTCAVGLLQEGRGEVQGLGMRVLWWWVAASASDPPCAPCLLGQSPALGYPPCASRVLGQNLEFCRAKAAELAMAAAGAASLCQYRPQCKCSPCSSSSSLACSSTICPLKGGQCLVGVQGAEQGQKGWQQRQGCFCAPAPSLPVKGRGQRWLDPPPCPSWLSQ